jgi:hypothetical protein
MCKNSKWFSESNMRKFGKEYEAMRNNKGEGESRKVLSVNETFKLIEMIEKLKHEGNLKNGSNKRA